MWHQIFTLGESPIAKILRALLIYAFLVVALRVAGKRDLAQLNSFDFVVLLAVANAVQNGLIGNDNSVTGALLGATVLEPSGKVVVIPKQPYVGTRQYQDLVRRIDELTTLVRAGSR